MKKLTLLATILFAVLFFSTCGNEPKSFLAVVNVLSFLGMVCSVLGFGLWRMFAGALLLSLIPLAGVEANQSRTFTLNKASGLVTVGRETEELPELLTSFSLRFNYEADPIFVDSRVGPFIETVKDDYWYLYRYYPTGVMTNESLQAWAVPNLNTDPWSFYGNVSPAGGHVANRVIVPEPSALLLLLGGFACLLGSARSCFGGYPPGCNGPPEVDFICPECGHDNSHSDYQCDCGVKLEREREVEELECEIEELKEEIEELKESTSRIDNDLLKHLKIDEGDFIHPDVRVKLELFLEGGA